MGGERRRRRRGKGGGGGRGGGGGGGGRAGDNGRKGAHELVEKAGFKGLVLDGGEGAEIGIGEPGADGNVGGGKRWSGRAEHLVDGLGVGDAPWVEIESDGRDCGETVFGIEMLARERRFEECRKVVGVSEG